MPSGKGRGPLRAALRSARVGVIMTRKLGLLMVVLGFALSVWATDSVPTGTISGTVRDSAGVVQMGATVQVFADALLPIATVFTDASGFFHA